MFAQEPPPDFEIAGRREPGERPELLDEVGLVEVACASGEVAPVDRSGGVNREQGGGEGGRCGQSLGDLSRSTTFDDGAGWVPSRTLIPFRKPFRVDSGRDGSWAVLTLSGDLDINTVTTFDAEVDRLFRNATQPTGLLVDTAGLTFADSSGIRAAVLAAQRVRGRFGLIRVPERLKSQIALKGLAIVLQSFPDLETAKAALS